MKHYYSACPDNPYGLTPWFIKDTNCLKCLQRLVLLYEQRYRTDPEETVSLIAQDLQYKP